MVDHSAHPPAAHPDAHDEEAFDNELNVRGIVLAGLAIAGGTIVSCVLMWWMMAGFHAFDSRQAVKAPVLPESAMQPAAPSPHLQSSPEEDMRTLRAQEDLALEQSAWVDEKQGTVRLPVDLAIDVLAEKGLPKVAPAPPAPPQPASLEAPTGATPTDQASVGSILPPAGQGLATTAPPTATAPAVAPSPEKSAPAKPPAKHPANPPASPPGGAR